MWGGGGVRNEYMYWKGEKEAARGFKTHHIAEYKPQIGFRHKQYKVEEDEGSVRSSEMSGSSERS